MALLTAPAYHITAPAQLPQLRVSCIRPCILRIGFLRILSIKIVQYLKFSDLIRFFFSKLFLSRALTLSDEKRIGVISVLQKKLLLKQRANFFWITRCCNEVVVKSSSWSSLETYFTVSTKVYVKYAPGLRFHAFIFQEFI